MKVTEFLVKDKKFRVEMTHHAYFRMLERNVDMYMVAGIILGLGERLLSYNNTGEEVAIMDRDNSVTVIVEVRQRKAVIITVIDKTNIYIKEGTKMEHIA